MEVWEAFNRCLDPLIEAKKMGVSPLRRTAEPLSTFPHSEHVSAHQGHA